MNKYYHTAARLYHKLYRTNFYNTSSDLQRRWAEAMKEVFDEISSERNP